MADFDDVRRIAAMMPGAEERVRPSGLTFFIRSTPFAWEARPWPSVAEPARTLIGTEPVLGVKVADRRDALALREMHPDVFLGETTPWSEPKILLRLQRIDVGHLTELVTESWRILAPRRAAREFDARGD